MKKIVVISSLVLILLLAGCSAESSDTESSNGIKTIVEKVEKEIKEIE